MTAPVLLVCGHGDGLVAPERQHDMAGKLPRSKEVSFSGEGHMMAVERPTVAAREVLAFLDNEDRVDGGRPCRKRAVSMKRVLLIGIKPEAVEISNPDFPPGTTSEKIAAGIQETLADMKARGWEGGFCSILPDESAEETIAASLTTKWDCIVIGGGIRVPTSGPLAVRASHQRCPPRRTRYIDRL